MIEKRVQFGSANALRRIKKVFVLNAISAVANYGDMAEQNCPGIELEAILPYTEGDTLFSVPFA